jgi:hypothetical protein
MPSGRVSRVVFSATALAVVALVVGILAERRFGVVEPQATPPLASASAPATAPASTPAASSILSDRFGFIWVDEPAKRLHVRPETGQGGFDLVTRAYRFSWCSCAASPDGARIAYWTNSPAGELRVVDVARPTQEATIYRAADDQVISAAAWSSDGTGILFALEGVGTSGGPPGGPPNSSLLVIEAGGGPARTLVGSPRGAPVYVPLGWDRTAGVAAAGESGEGGYMGGYLTVRTSGDPAPQETGIPQPALMLSVDVSSDQRFALGLFSDPTGNTLRWWRLGDFGTIQSGPRLNSLVRPKWRPFTSEIGWVEGGVLQLLDVGRGTKRTDGKLPSADYGVSAFRRDGSAVATTAGSGYATLLEIGSGSSETIGAPGYIAGSVRFGAIASPTQPSPSSGTPPPLNARELRVINALGTLGIKGQRAQLPYQEASIWADFGTAASALLVSAFPLGVVDRNYTVIDERRLSGVAVQHVRRPSSDDRTSSRFECSGDEYWVSGAVPPGFADMDAFVERFITALACSP